jgi:DnaJ homologue, subfamily C, member 28, conserved domain
LAAPTLGGGPRVRAAQTQVPENRYIRNVDEWNFIAERKIREAIDEGAFERLEGMGEPLDLSENPFEDPSLRLAHRLLKNNGFAPNWIEESREIDAEIGRIQDRTDASAEDISGRVAALNRRILTFNLKAPASSLHKRMFRLDT